MRILFIISLFISLTLSNKSFAQDSVNHSIDSLKSAVLQLQIDVDNVQLRLNESRKDLQTGIVVATLGYTVTIIGGQLLGTKPQLGETLLYTGGAIGMGGTYFLFRGFKKLRFKKPNY